jgi:hypothetical protein
LVDEGDDLVHPFAVRRGEGDERREFRVQDLESTNRGTPPTRRDRSVKVLSAATTLSAPSLRSTSAACLCASGTGRPETNLEREREKRERLTRRRKQHLDPLSALIVTLVDQSWNAADPARPLGQGFVGSDDFIRAKFAGDKPRAREREERKTHPAPKAASRPSLRVPCSRILERRRPGETARSRLCRQRRLYPRQV